ncbi:DNA adenine methylase [Streptomyces flavalbus]|uniref:Site-specific DNA-methyltransferase (adenine-specific) n=1 Tax=Streptomyces flavalbus TaxID=2665155 RepID=A0ABW2WIH2_9ACTN
MTPPLITISKLASLARVPHAFPYQGSKRQLAHTILPLIPSDAPRLLEPFAGSAAISIAVRYVSAVDSTIIGDVNEPLMTLWRSILQDPSSLADAYERLWTEQLDDPRSYYEQVRQKFNATQEPEYFLYLLARCVKSAVRYNRQGEFNQGADHRRLGTKPAAMRKRLLDTSATMTGTIIRTGDYQAILDLAQPGDVVYMDPPYEGVTNVPDRRYMQGLLRSEFEDSLAAAIKRDVSFILSYDGATGAKSYGTPLPESLGMLHLHLHAGRSSQATLQGLDHVTIESLYLSPALVKRLGGEPAVLAALKPDYSQPSLL